LLAIFAADAAEPGDSVAVPVDTSLAVADFLAENSVDVTYTPVGDVYVADAASEPGSPSAASPAAPGYGPRRRCVPTDRSRPANWSRSTPSGRWATVSPNYRSTPSAGTASKSTTSAA